MWDIRNLRNNNKRELSPKEKLDEDLRRQVQAELKIKPGRRQVAVWGVLKQHANIRLEQENYTRLMSGEEIIDSRSGIEIAILKVAQKLMDEANDIQKKSGNTLPYADRLPVSPREEEIMNLLKVARNKIHEFGKQHAEEQAQIDKEAKALLGEDDEEI